jgi:catechol 2,3-dioxygenase-like lactoylglutathione lyase family enzyme
MSDRRIELAETIKAMRPMVPARDFKTRKQFYRDLGFQPRMIPDDLAKMTLGSCSFILQNYYVEDWAGNSVIHLYVSKVQPWWDRIVAADLAGRYGVKTRAPHQAEWGATVVYLIDPAGVLWWFHQADTA